MDKMAATWTPITKAAPITAATIWEIARVSFGPRVRNSPMVKTVANAVDSAPKAMMTP